MTGIFITAMTESKAKDRTVTVLDSNDAIGRAAAEIIGKAYVLDFKSLPCSSSLGALSIRSPVVHVQLLQGHQGT